MDAIKGFRLDENGDVLIENGEIGMVHGAELTQQTIKSVLGTQKGEWFLNLDEGINYQNILGKKRYVSKNSALNNQYIKEMQEITEQSEQKEQAANALNERLAKRLDGVD